MAKIKDSLIMSSELQEYVISAITEGAFAFRYIANYAEDQDKKYFIDKSDQLLAVAESIAKRF